MKRAALLSAFLVASVAGLLVLLQGDAQTPGPPPTPSTAPITLSDGWTRADDRTGRGLAAGWQHGRFPGTAVTVPNVANADAPTGRPAWDAWRGSVAWYRRTIKVPSAGDWRLTFGSVHFDATVWLDGRRLGSHRGAHEPFGFVLERLIPGRSYRLVVRADYRDPQRQTDLGFYRAWFNWGGINRPVTLRRLGASELEQPAVQTTLRAGGPVVRVAVTVRNRLDEARLLAVRGAIAGEPLLFGSVWVPAGGARRVEVEAAVPSQSLWSPQRPQMVDLRVEVPGETLRTERTGLREIRADQGRLTVNGEPLRMRGASIHEDVPRRGDALTDSDRRDIVRRLQAIGANATRAQHSLDPRLLDMFDRAGIVVWQHIGPFDAIGRWRAGDSGALTASAEARSRRQVIAERLHPSIIAWNLVNEVAGNGASDAQVQYVRRMARELRRIDPGRLVAVDIWGKDLPRKPGALYDPLDAVGLTDYTGWAVLPLAPRKARAAARSDLLARFSDAFDDKVRIVAEFGAGGNKLNSPRSFGGVNVQARLIGEQLRAYDRERGLDGALVWVLRDFRLSPDYVGGSARRLVPSFRVTPGLNDKGLFDRAGRAKPAVVVVARSNARAGGSP